MAALDSTAPDRPLPGASFGVAYQRFWARSFVFSGRASRSEYWWAALANVLVSALLYIGGLVLLLAGSAVRDSGSTGGVVGAALGGVVLLIFVLFSLAQLVPSIAVAVRRLHDADYSGLLYLIAFIPFGSIVLLVLTAMPSNPAGRRFDRGGWAPQPGWAPPAAVAPAYRPAAPPTSMPRSFTPLDAWPAPEPRAETAPMPEQATEPGLPAADPIRDAWTAVGAVTAVDARLSGQPSWRRVGYLLAERPDGIGVLATSGLAESEGATALGPGAEVYLASSALAGRAATVPDGWEFALLASVARRIGASGMHLPAELEQHRALSMAVAAPTAPLEWKAPDGSVGVLLGVPLPGVPDAVATPGGEVRLVGVTPLRPSELERILADGRDARASIAAALSALPAATLAAPDRRAV